MQAPFEAIFTQIAEIKCSQERLESEMRRCMHDLKYFIGMKLEDVEARQKVMQVDQAVRHQDAEAKLTVLERAIQHVLASMEGQFVALYVLFCHYIPFVSLLCSHSEYNSIARAYNSLHSRRATLLPIKNGNNVAYPNFPFNVAEFMAATGACTSVLSRVFI
jgi:hypothetical protein